MSNEPDEYEAKISTIIHALFAAGPCEFARVLAQAEGADPALVRKLYDQVQQARSASTVAGVGGTQAIRHAAASFLARLPAANPELAQWWFDVETIQHLVERIVSTGCTKRAMCLGAPTVAFGLAYSGVDTTALDADEHVLEALQKAAADAPSPGQLSPCLYDVAGESLQDRVSGVVSIAFLDPPWYVDWFARFFSAALPSVAQGGHLFVSLPPRLTRKSAEQDRASAIAAVSAAGFDILAVERGLLKYTVPRFEAAAYNAVEGFDGLSWRRGDLLHAIRREVLPDHKVRTIVLGRLHSERVNAYDGGVEAYARQPHQYRVFVRKQVPPDLIADGPSEFSVAEIDGYGATVSRRGVAAAYPDLWTSEKFGIRLQSVNQWKTFRWALDCWRGGQDLEGAIRTLHPHKHGREICEWLEAKLNLWSRFEERETPSERRAQRSMPPEFVHREHASPGDGYRDVFLRDRSRIVWSTGLRKLANKTQVFPSSQDHQLRQRLTHSTEVMQLAATIGNALGLNTDLIEAGALAHDIGHSPFGHAGEHAIHFVLSVIHDKLFFNHYEHGVDVIRYLEGPYLQHPGHAGLDLARGTAECIFKHIYFHRAERRDAPSPCAPPSPPGSLEEMCKLSKHAKYLGATQAQPEAQAVRLADKISYLISDIEDGIRLGAISMEDLRRCRLFSRPPIDLAPQPGESAGAAFLRERPRILAVLMQDAITASAQRWFHCSRAGGGIPEDVYLIDNSMELAQDISQIWHELQHGRLHAFPEVRLANVRAGRVVSQLVVALALMPGLVDEAFREAYEGLKRSRDGAEYFGHYRALVGGADAELEVKPELASFLQMERAIGEGAGQRKVRIDDLILAKDFVASLSDTQAEDLHARVLGSIR